MVLHPSISLPSRLARSIGELQINDDLLDEIYLLLDRETEKCEGIDNDGSVSVDT